MTTLLCPACLTAQNVCAIFTTVRRSVTTATYPLARSAAIKAMFEQPICMGVTVRVAALVTLLRSDKWAFRLQGRTAEGSEARTAALTQQRIVAMPKFNTTTPSQNIVNLTPSQQEFVRLLLDENIHESGQNDDLDYYINVQIKGRWTKLIWLPSEVQPLVDAGYLYQFPNRWNQEHLVVVVNDDYRGELSLAVLL